jgi:hypothetical protein
MPWTRRVRCTRITQRLTLRIVAFDRPRSFRDSMVSGAFAYFDHDHLFEPDGPRTRMIDIFDFASPLGPLGRLADWLVLTGYRRRRVQERALSIKRAAKSEEWEIGDTIRKCACRHRWDGIAYCVPGFPARQSSSRSPSSSPSS